MNLLALIAATRHLFRRCITVSLVTLFLLSLSEKISAQNSVKLSQPVLSQPQQAADLWQTGNTKLPTAQSPANTIHSPHALGLKGPSQQSNQNRFNLTNRGTNEQRPSNASSFALPTQVPRSDEKTGAVPRGFPIQKTENSKERAQYPPRFPQSQPGDDSHTPQNHRLINKNLTPNRPSLYGGANQSQRPKLRIPLQITPDHGQLPRTQFNHQPNNYSGGQRIIETVPGLTAPEIPSPIQLGTSSDQKGVNQRGFKEMGNHLSSQDTSKPQTGVEIVRERYDNGAIKIERQVILDDENNYINHGTWKYYLSNGRVAAEATFERGKKTGTWSRWITPQEVPVLRRPPFNQFQAPFLSTFQYQNDLAEGAWKLSDAVGRAVFVINLASGKRNSVCTWFFHNGKKWQEIHYENGVPHGPFLQWNNKGEMIGNRRFIEGKEVITKTEFHRPGVKSLQFGILAGKVEPITHDNPWSLEFSNQQKIGVDIKDGPIVAWYSNGQIQFTGQYKNGIQSGKFTWFYPTGQKQAEGSFANDQRTGNWVWWHENGMRASLGNYASGSPSGEWQWWMADGKHNRSRSFSEFVEPIEQMKNASFRDLPKE